MELDLIQVIKELGFPIGIAVYFIYDRTILMRKFIQSNNEQTTVLRMLCAKVGIETTGGVVSE